ncbi:TPA_asm: hypothetical protein [ssRNA phage Gerhypos.4_30]|uniref:Transmembrane protein n=2 Tax=Fiersviridae TaxID=2842319 RepID=A0A8S5L1Q4_9VIRU|nr:hypothetical protein QIL52_gp2 [ssRNA phage Gerhypos.4_30]QDH86632.1 MAG: hypothetical protein H4Bulk46582_000004 [Leviviridae sp.]DAD51372.1 TPA_asm: hypothetical protein [ssRNA phage Gerhypos.4_30]
MKSTRLYAAEFASRSQRSSISRSKKSEAGALRSLEGDRGLPEGLGKRSVEVHQEGIAWKIAAYGFAFSCFSVGCFFLVLSSPYIYTAFHRLLKAGL